jgi:hypothetical protein
MYSDALADYWSEDVYQAVRDQEEQDRRAL